MKTILSLTFILTLFFINTVLKAQLSSTDLRKGNPPPHKIIMQLTSSDPEVHKALINQISAIKKRWVDSVWIDVVVHGPGMDILIAQKTAWEKEIEEFYKKGVIFYACENTLKQKNIPRESLIKSIDYIPFGLVEIVLKQEKGWSYLKAGF